VLDNAYGSGQIVRYSELLVSVFEKEFDIWGLFPHSVPYIDNLINLKEQLDE